MGKINQECVDTNVCKVFHVKSQSLSWRSKVDEMNANWGQFHQQNDNAK